MTWDNAVLLEAFLTTLLNQTKSMWMAFESRKAQYKLILFNEYGILGIL